MPTRISAGVGDHPCFLAFYDYDPIDCKITNFSVYLFACFQKNKTERMHTVLKETITWHIHLCKPQY